MSWVTNPIMEWSFDSGVTWSQVTDHGRSPLSVSIERIESKQRMADGRMRRYVVAKKRTFSCSWDNLPDKASPFLANGDTPGEWIENIHDTVDGSFHMRLREGSDRTTTFPPGLESGTILEVMISDFSKEIIKRGENFDLWSLDITLEEV